MEQYLIGLWQYRSCSTCRLFCTLRTMYGLQFVGLVFNVSFWITQTEASHVFGKSYDCASHKFNITVVFSHVKWPEENLGAGILTETSCTSLDSRMEYACHHCCYQLFGALPRIQIYGKSFQRTGNIYMHKNRSLHHVHLIQEFGVILSHFSLFSHFD